MLTPEATIQAQKAYASDIIIPLDEVPSVDCVGEELRLSVERSHRWEGRSLIEHYKDAQDQAIYGVIHGGLDRELRLSSTEFVTSMPFDGIAIGGSLGRDHAELEILLNWLVPEIKKRSAKPIHLLGLADEQSIRLGVKLGIDTFDSCFPTRLARHGTLLTKTGKVHVRNKKFIKGYGIPIEEGCGCSTCKGGYDMAYLNHLFKASEVNFIALAVSHNVYWMGTMMKEIRRDIREGRL
jgi:queuine tRNA-ribosyltransferase